MRCLRCALDYGPEERYCQRCGRSLSRPPGFKDDGNDQFSGLQDTQYLYSTFAPPGEDQSARTVVDPPPPRLGLPPSLALARSTTANRGNAAALPPARAATPFEAPAFGDADAEEILGAADLGVPPRAALPGSVYIAPPSDPRSAPWSGAGRAPVDLDDDQEDDVLAAFRVKPAAIGMEAGSRRKSPAQKRALSGLPKRPLLVGGLVVLIILLVGAVGLVRHGAYTADLHAAQRLTAAARYPEAVANYNKAIADWPFNSDAKNGLANVRSTVLSIQATATAVTLQNQANADAASIRQAIYQTHTGQRQQVAVQADANAIATATAAIGSH